MSRETPETAVSTPIQELRDAMDRVREVQGTSGMFVDLARYDADTTDTNSEFLQGFLGALPVQLGYSDNGTKDTVADRFEIEDPILVRSTTTFGAIVREGYKSKSETAFIVGERRADKPKLPMTELLLVGQQRTVSPKGNTWLPSSPRITTIKVAADSWEKQREENVNRLGTPYGSEQLMARFSAGLGKFVIGSGGILDTPWIFAPKYPEDITSRYDRSQYRYVEKRRDGDLVGIQKTVRSLRSSDFEAFDVMMHMEYIVAAYGIGKVFDAVKATREAKMPPHPATTVLGLPGDYRQMMEQRGLQAL